MKLPMQIVLVSLAFYACGQGDNNPFTQTGTKDENVGDSATGFCQQDETWICPELCDRMSCGGMDPDCIRACSAELQDCKSSEMLATCSCFDTYLVDVVCQTWEEAQPMWDACISKITCFDDY
jgi:hypothetical protein